MRYLSILVDIRDRFVLVVGGGNVALRKVRMLIRVGAKIKIVSKFLCSELLELDENKHIEWISKRFDQSLLIGIFLVIVATSDEVLNALVYKIAEENRILINVVDDPLKCSFIFPSVIDRHPIIIAVSSCGKSPILSRILREKLESLLPNYLGLMASLAGYWRSIVKRYISNVITRRKFWENMFYGSFANLISRNKIIQANNILFSSLISLKHSFNNKGMISLVGAGPGDSGLFTLRGLQLIQQADIVLYDSLVSKEILDMIRRDAKCICVGKRFGGCSMDQRKINDLLIKFANQGKQVVRLKGGDPFIFGRGGEELCAIAKTNIPFQIVPGITAAFGAAAYAGIPLTHRKYSRSVVFISGYLNHDDIDILNWRMLAFKDQTIVVYMGITNAYKISELLINNGRDPATLVAVISRATCKDQNILVMKLEQLKFLSKFTILLPALLIIGEIVSVYSSMPCFGKQILKNYKFGSIIQLS